jgi:DNA polymerase III subunit epsilon
MSDRFVAIDVETANADLASICQIGVVSFQHGEVAEAWKTLIDPEDEFDGVNVSIHGIDERMVAGAPRFPDIVDALHTRLAGHVVVSHMPFDRVALSRAHERYGIPTLDCTWLDTARVTRRAWPQFSRRGYGLADVASWCGIEFRHHDAEEDARAAGLVLLRALTDSGLGVDDWVVQATRPIGGSLSSSSITRAGDPDGPLAGEVLVFTGALSIPRREAADLAAAAGCDVVGSVGRKVTLLVVGDQDVRKLVGHEKSSKHRKAEDLIRNGQVLRILRESDFRTLVTATT